MKPITEDQMNGGWYRLWTADKLDSVWACFDRGTWIVGYYSFGDFGMRAVSLENYKPDFSPMFWDVQSSDAFTSEMDRQKDETKTLHIM